MSEMNHEKYAPPPTPEDLGLTSAGSNRERLSGELLPKMKKFRFQLLADWVAENFEPRSVADIAGGKGLLSYLLGKKGIHSTVIDPVAQDLPKKYKDLSTKKRIMITKDESVDRVSQPFTKEMAKEFDLLIGLHAHGVNMLMIDAVASYGNKAVIMPCCVIDEPEVPPLGENWFSWLADYATDQGLDVEYFHLNFSGQNVGFVVSRPETNEDY